MGHRDCLVRQVNELFYRIVPLRSDVNYAMANITKLNTESANHGSNITYLLAHVATAEDTLSAAVRSLPSSGTPTVYAPFVRACGVGQA